MSIKAVLFDSNGVIYTSAGINRELLEYCKSLRNKGLITGILTNSSVGYRQRIEADNLTEYFNEFFISEELNVYKPHPDIFTKVQTKLNCLPSEIMFLDDTPEHVRAAKQAGWQAYLYASLEETKQIIKSLI